MGLVAGVWGRGVIVAQNRLRRENLGFVAVLMDLAVVAGAAFNTQ